MSSLRRILLVEDEPLIAMMLEDFLDALDREVAGTADCVAAALAAIEQGGIDAAILDVNLRGGEKSWPVADALAAAGIPFVVATGGDTLADAHRDRPVLAKPFTMDGVEKALGALA
ncbi:response regulator [Sphingomonas japonica]|uniref:DNA-binding response OmpR family regulator n=1 Tax=Sphingomonas japonica TaxID=511662 RepID=A0ABX0U3L4_9SPHN|nr:response regulator [Sphingomonas japonica]NIJ25163.1 DNA-binding response OmpR family regulator [Sphingomonas japonica]